MLSLVNPKSRQLRTTRSTCRTPDVPQPLARTRFIVSLSRMTSGMTCPAGTTVRREGGYILGCAAAALKAPLSHPSGATLRGWPRLTRVTRSVGALGRGGRSGHRRCHQPYLGRDPTNSSAYATNCQRNSAWPHAAGETSVVVASQQIEVTDVERPGDLVDDHDGWATNPLSRRSGPPV